MFGCFARTRVRVRAQLLGIGGKGGVAPIQVADDLDKTCWREFGPERAAAPLGGGRNLECEDPGDRMAELRPKAYRPQGHHQNGDSEGPGGDTREGLDHQ